MEKTFGLILFIIFIVILFGVLCFLFIYLTKSPKRINTIRQINIQPIEKNKIFIPEILIIDTETTGLFLDNSIRSTAENIKKHPNNFPKVVQISCLLLDKFGNYESNVFLIKQNQKIPEESIKIHGITDEDCEIKGIDLDLALRKVSELSSKVNSICGHNLNFDYKVLKTEFLRSELNFPLSKKIEFAL